ncbi:MAG TPA: hypothetical protein PKA41_09865 [Verrucomicrobiota bacterium]|nr:hypothetical protein [Verrucomicrobiota bacterium]
MKTEKLTKKTSGKSTKKPATVAPPVTATAPVAAKTPAPVAAKTPAPKTTVKTETKPAAAPVTTIEAKIDVGFGNRLFVRGQGAGLSWEQGTPLTCVDAKTWRWSGSVQEKLTFKLLLNDAIWAKGEDVVVSPGKRAEITPSF